MMCDQDFSGKKVGRYLFCCLLGCGAAGSVYQAVDMTLKDSPIFAIKCVEKSPHDRRRLQQVAEILNHDKVTCCRNVMPLCDFFEDGLYFFLVFPLCDMDMRRAIWDDKLYWRDDELIRRMFIGILDGVFECHRKGIYHRDLKPENIMCNLDGRDIRISDFGLSTNRRLCYDGGCGTTYYMSPECLDDETNYYYADTADIWSLGVILFNMVTRQYPWAEARLTDKHFMAFMRKKDHLMRTSPISEPLSLLLDQMWHPIPLRRLPIPAIRQAVLEMDTFYKRPAVLRRVSSSHSLAKAIALAVLDSQEPPVGAEKERDLCGDTLVEPIAGWTEGHKDKDNYCHPCTDLLA